jgi:hypothetical protein
MPPRRHDKDFDSHDAAQICVNGHYILGFYHDSPGFRQKYCRHCGALTIFKCEHCDAEITGHYRNTAPIRLREEVPAHCHNCGRPYPWIAAKIHAAKAMADELDGLTDAERILLKASIDDIAANTPMTEVAVVRVKKVMPKIGGAIGEAFRKLIVDVSSETAAKLLKGP